MSRKFLPGLAPLLLLFLVLAGCSAADPLTDDLYTESSYIRLAADGSGGYWREYNKGGINLSSGGSGATEISPNISTLGGWQLNAVGEYVFFDMTVEDDYDGASDAVLFVYFEVNDDNSGGLDTDTVDFQVEYWVKQLGDRTNTNTTYNVSTTVGKAQQHDLFVAVLNYTPTAESIIAFRVELTVVTSDVDDVIINYVRMGYPVSVSALERS